MSAMDRRTNMIISHIWWCCLCNLFACPASSHYLNQCWLIVNWTPGNNFQCNLNRNHIVLIQENTFEIVVCQNGGHFVQGRWYKHATWIPYMPEHIHIYVHIRINHVNHLRAHVMRGDPTDTYVRGCCKIWKTPMVKPYVVHYQAVKSC